jgi:hypothetical protein
MDNGGENKSLANMLKSKEWKFPLKIEYTARDTPQQNSLVETAFAANVRHALAVYVAAGVPQEWLYLLFPHVMKYLLKMKNLQPIELNGVIKSQVEHFHGTLPAWAKHLRTFGEAGTVKIRTKMQPKLDNCGVICMFVGYPDQHPEGKYYMLNPDKKSILVTRDVIFLDRMYFPHEGSSTVDVIDTIQAREGGRLVSFEDYKTDTVNDDNGQPVVQPTVVPVPPPIQPIAPPIQPIAPPAV